ncbi:hypothetical protein ACFO3D_00475 [Virgibacillus kekensis]|uniref:Uncharacterized protein n=1 Tax=Virgibacillus kekensis TaxID=202261 RepID=A0ABV9DD14_9BACI
MNTEINFLEKQPKKTATNLITVALLIIFLVLLTAIFFYQKVTYQTDTDNKQLALAEIESKLINQQDSDREAINIYQLKKNIADMESALPDNLTLYKKVTGLLENPGQLINYDSSKKKLVVMAKFPELEQIAKYIGTMGDQVYINDIQLTSVVRTGEFYHATLTVTPDTQALGKELAERD